MCVSQTAGDTSPYPLSCPVSECAWLKEGQCWQPVGWQQRREGSSVSAEQRVWSVLCHWVLWDAHTGRDCQKMCGFTRWLRLEWHQTQIERPVVSAWAKLGAQAAVDGFWLFFARILKDQWCQHGASKSSSASFWCSSHVSWLMSFPVKMDGKLKEKTG